MYQLIIKNGRVLDPANGIDRVASVAVENGRIVGVGSFCCGDHLIHGGVRFSVTDIICNGTDKQVDILRYDAYVFSQRIKTDLTQVDPVKLY